MSPTPPTPPTATNVKKSRAGKLRRTLGWTLLTLGLIVAAVWVWSGASGKSTGVRFHSASEDVSVGIVIGRMEVDRWTPPATTPPKKMWFGDKGGFLRNISWSGEFILGARVASAGMSRTLYAVPLPAFFVPAAAAGAGLLWWSARVRRRAMTGSCGKCGYSLAGLAPDAACPECGKAKAD